MSPLLWTCRQMTAHGTVRPLDHARSRHDVSARPRLAHDGHQRQRCHRRHLRRSLDHGGQPAACAAGTDGDGSDRRLPGRVRQHGDRSTPGSRTAAVWTTWTCATRRSSTGCAPRTRPRLRAPRQGRSRRCWPRSGGTRRHPGRRAPKYARSCRSRSGRTRWLPVSLRTPSRQVARPGRCLEERVRRRRVSGRKP
jgi:hypothetical protein